jgi:hypothetical protein
MSESGDEWRVVEEVPLATGSHAAGGASAPPLRLRNHAILISRYHFHVLSLPQRPP